MAASTAMADPLRTRLQADLAAAMRARDRARLTALRTALGALANAEAVDASASRPAIGLGANEAERRIVDERDATTIVVGLRDELRRSAIEMRGLGQPSVAGEQEHQADILDGYLDDPPEPSSP